MSKSGLALALASSLLLMEVTSLDANAMTVEDAYKAIPHARTVFDASSSKLTPVQTDALERLFDFSDRGLVLRIEGMRALHGKDLGGIKSVLSNYQTLTRLLSALDTPKEIKPVQDLLLQSLEHHRKYFDAKFREGGSDGKFDLAFTPDVYQSSNKLRAAYSLLMQTFPNESAANRQAFYDYLCALDFQ